MPQHFVSKFVDVAFGGVINFVYPPFEVHASGVSCKHFIFLFLHSAGFEKQTYCSQHLYLRILLVVFLSIVSLDSCCLHVILLSSTHLLLAMYSLHEISIGAIDVVGAAGCDVVVVVTICVMGVLPLLHRYRI